MPRKDVAFLGPPGTYSELVARKQFGVRNNFVPLPSIHDVCSFVARDAARVGIVPIENSSGGAIYEMVDILLANRPRVFIQEEISLNVRLALLGRKDERIKTLYSHFVPLDHCDAWLKKHLPRVDKESVPSTAMAAQRAWQQPHAAALGNRDLAKVWNLDVLQYPIATDEPNITVFLALGGRQRSRPHATKLTLAVQLLNEPGSLCTFLECFRDQDVNLSRLLSRPMRGCPQQYIFLVDIQGNPTDIRVKRAMTAARKASAKLRIVGAYPSGKLYNS
ncbi:MAG: prephenate dehydratase [Verrucomicrobia bacterium]|jgi:chorismate mutase / prephenate dehydratase|nr:prephenate dehydratase [Verrucomicrobiota bacterium]MBT7065456.1 prephenate dehydratase [Verrucomicrobiota bacterium]MBT7701566.1 prephenate dehydratase [Verrucomicrobiota bacterium]